MTESTRTLAEARAWCKEQRRVASGNQAPLPTGVQYVESLIARLDQPCGSCHPCTNYADETWRAAGRTPPHVYEWDELRAEVERLRAENARQSEMLGKVAAVHNGCPNTLDDVVCPWCRIAALENEADWLQAAEDRVHRAFADADVEGVDLNAMTVAELTALIMNGIKAGGGPGA